MADSDFPETKLAPNGKAPAAFIMHHTAGRGEPASVVNDWRENRPGIGAQYIMGRDGVIHDVQKEFGYGGTNEILNGTGSGKGLSNSNVVGMEIVANDDKDVTPQQAQAAAAFIQARYPNVPLFGHGQVNPGHRDETEGMTAVNAAMALRGGDGAGTGQPAHPGTPTPTQTTMFSGLNSDARGMRNNNPGNLVANDWTASLPGYKGSDGKFAIFDTPQHGANALDQNLAHYGTRGINTPLAIASTWSPASDNNNPNSYGAQIAKALGVGPNDKIDINDPAVRTKVAQAIALVENGPGKSSGFSVGVPGSTINTTGGPSGSPGAVASATAPAPAGGAPGATGTAAGAGGTVLPGFGTQQSSDAFLKSAKGLEKAMGKGGDGQGQSGPPDIQPSQMVGPPSSAQNVSPLLAMIPMTYGQTINSLQNPLTWNSNPPSGRPPGAGVGGQGPMGTSLNSMAMMDPNGAQFPQVYPSGMGYMGMGYSYPGGGMPYG